jgi:hypothetical protein
MNTCEFNELSTSHLHELHQYLNLLLDNNLIDKNDKITKALYVVHPDRRTSNENITSDDYTCATTIFNGYLNYLNENNIQDKSINYALNLQPTSASSFDNENENENENFINTFMKLSTIDPELTSENIIARTTVLGEAVFGVKFDRENPTVIDQNPLPLIIGQEFDESQLNYNKLDSQFESFQYYTKLLVEFNYLLCFSFLLKQYSNELDKINNPPQLTNVGGKKKKSRKNKNKKKSKTKRNKIGGTIPENLEEYNNFYSWVTGKIGRLTSLSPEVITQLEKSNADIKFYQESVENLQDKRKDFYEEYDRLLEENKVIEQNNEKLANAPVYKWLTSKPSKVIDINTRILGNSTLENNLRLLWIKQRKTFEQIDQLKRELKELEQKKTLRAVDVLDIIDEKYKGLYKYVKNSNDDDYKFNEYKIEWTLSDAEIEERTDGIIPPAYSKEEVTEYNKAIDAGIASANDQNIIIETLSTSILQTQEKINNMQIGCDREEKKIIDVSKIRNKLDLFVNNVISAQFLGKDKVDIFLNLCENRLREVFFGKIEVLAKTQAILPMTLRISEYNVQTPMKKDTLSSYIDRDTFSENLTISTEVYEHQKQLQKSTLLDTLSNQVEIFKKTVKNKYEIKSEKADEKLSTINSSFYENELFKKINDNITYQIASGSILFLNSYGDNPFEKIVNTINMPAVISSSVYAILNTVSTEPQLIVPKLDMYYVYFQIVIVAFVTPNLLKNLFPTFDNKLSNAIILLLQILLILSFVIINFYGLENGTTNAYFPTTMTNLYSKQTSSWSDKITQGVGIPSGPYLWEFFTSYIPNVVTNNVVLNPSYFLRDMVSKNGKSIIGAESWGLLFSSIIGMRTNYNKLGLQRKKLLSQAKTELKEFVFDSDDFKVFLNNEIEDLKKSGNAEEYSKLIDAVNQLGTQLNSRFALSLKAVGTTAAVESAIAAKKHNEIVQGQSQGQTQGQTQGQSQGQPQGQKPMLRGQILSDL